ncbi:ERCC4 domain-containing protein [Intestinibacter bartlettii]|uniref:ERCC4 domain-containing protein n=1 Tax=Intestinibacter bartlettii TaxID=261299 RepID=UPI001D021587|nr:ERCC4 domain-containing protein [Intestinibacter bartlettii]MCB5745365.1 ERCC4 domain-containing protein [Intestinibacter bartlettii]
MLKINAKDYTVMFDTREQDLFIPAVLHKKGIQVKRQKLDTGDYAIEYKDGYIPPVVVERKASCDELISNMLDHRKDANGNNRFIRELQRSKQQGLKVYLLIQDKDYYLKLITGEYRSKVNPKAISGMIISLLAKYPNLHIIAVDKELSPSMVYKILYYELRENLKDMLK